MARADVEGLARELGGDPPEAFNLLSSQAHQALIAALRAARSRQRNQLDQALTQALQHVPVLMRGPVRKILGL